MFIRNVFLTLSTEFITVAGNFMLGILLARGLSVPERGLMALVMALPWTVASLVNLGLPQANIYLIGRQKYDARTVLGASLAAALGIGLLAALLMWGLREQALATVLKDLPEGYYLPLIALVPLLLVDGVLLSILRSHQRFDLFNLRRLATTLFMLVGFGAALLLVRGGLTLVVWVYVGVTAGLVLLNLAVTHRLTPVTMTFNRAFTGESLRFGLKSYVQNMAGALTYRLDIYLLAFFLAPEQVAYYAIATTVAELAWYVPDTVGVVLFPRLANMPVDEIHAVTARVCRSTMAATTLVVAAMGAIGWLVLPWLYGAAYRASILPLMILLPGIVFMGIYKVLTRNYSSQDRQQVSIAAALAALGTSLALNLVLIPRWGVAGAAFASTVGYTTAGLLILAFFLRDSGLPWYAVLLPRPAEVSGHVRWARLALQGLGKRNKAHIPQE